MNFIRKVFEKKVDEETHHQFSRFSKGTFENKALIDITVTGRGIKLKTSSEFTNELVQLLAHTIKEPVPVKGVIFSTQNLSKESKVEFSDVKSAIGVRKHFIDQELSKEDLLYLCKTFPEASLNLSFSTDYGSLTVKEKIPKSAKPGKGDEDPKADFCVFTSEDLRLLENYAFDVKAGFKKLFIKHTYTIVDITISNEYKTDFAMARKMGVRKGRVIRYLTIDGTEEKHETELCA